MPFVESDHWIRICDQDIAMAGRIAECVLEREKQKKIKNRGGNRQIKDREFAHTLGFCGEAAVARYLDIEWYSPETIKDMGARHKGDLQFGIEVKTREEPGRQLLMSKFALDKLHPRTPIVHVIGAVHPTYELMGWVLAKDFMNHAKRLESGAREINHCYIIPDAKLRNIDELKGIIEQWKTRD